MDCWPAPAWSQISIAGRGWMEGSVGMVPCLSWPASNSYSDVVQACLISYWIPLFLVMFFGLGFLVFYWSLFHSFQFKFTFFWFRHVLEDCVAVEACRVREGIRAFLSECRGAGWSRRTSFRYYVTGLDKDGVEISRKDHLLRGASLARLTDAWLNTWTWFCIVFLFLNTCCELCLLICFITLKVS